MQPVGAKSFRFTLSTATVDRAGDILNQDGWELSAYRRSPVVLWMHDHRLPIGRGIDVRVEGGRLEGTAVLDPSETPVTGAFAEMRRMKLAAGSLFACSVGFQPISFEISKRINELIGFDFDKQSLVEFSIVSAPCNTEALVDDPNDLQAALASMVNASASRGTRKVTAGAMLRRLEIFDRWPG